MSGCCVGPRIVLQGAPLPPPEPVLGEAFADTNTNLQATADGTWTPVAGAVVTLPAAGTYEVTAEVRGFMNATGNSFITGRLFNVTTAAVVPDSVRLVTQVIGQGGQNNTAPIGTFITVAGPTTIQVQAQRTGPTTTAGIRSDGNGLTRIAFRQIGGAP